MNTSLYREAHPPTGVTAVVSGFLTHTTDVDLPNLVVARTTELDIFKIR